MAASDSVGGQRARTRAQVPTPVKVGFDGSAPQSRLTVPVRIFMVIPQLVVVTLLGIRARAVTCFGWFAALFTGRLPGFAADFLTGFLRWQTRVFAATATRVQDGSVPVSTAIGNYTADVSKCNGQLACVTRLGRNVGATSALATSVPSTAAIFSRLGAATTASQYISLAGQANLNTSLNQANQDYENLGKALNS